jgi:hypothetical protein
MDFYYIFVHEMVYAFELHKVNDNQVIELVDIVLQYKVYDLFAQEFYKVEEEVVDEEFEDVDDVVRH